MENHIQLSLNDILQGFFPDVDLKAKYKNKLPMSVNEMELLAYLRIANFERITVKFKCTAGCKERHKSDVPHNAFEIWLKDISIKPELAALYLAVMENVFKANEGDRDAEIKKLHEKIKTIKELLRSAALKLPKDDIDKFVYHTVRDKVNEENRAFEYKITELKKLESGFKEYCHYGISLLSNMGHYYTTATIENKQRMPGLIFPEKLVFSNNTFQTMQPNEILTLLCNAGNGFSPNEKGLSKNKLEKSCVVTSIGFKPITF